MKYLWTTLHVTDLERSLKFYQEVVGLPFQTRFSPPGSEIVFLGDGETKIELIRDIKIPVVDLGAHGSLGFAVANLEEALAHVKAHGVAVTAGPIQAGPRTRFFFVKDPDGMTIQFVEEK